MAKISNTGEYPFRSPQLTDYVIGTASTGSPNLKTSNFLISDILALVTPGPGPGPTPTPPITNLTVPIWKDAESKYVDSQITQEDFTFPMKYTNINGWVWQSGLGKSTYFGTEAGSKDGGVNGGAVGNENVGLGQGALEEYTLGDGGDGAIVAGQNTAVGTNSLNTLLTGVNNTAVGYNSASLETIGNSNTVVGANALDGGVSGALANTAVGTGSMTKDSATTDQQFSRNSSLGFKAISANDASVVANNVAIGFTAMSENTDTVDGEMEFMDYNVAIGYRAYSISEVPNGGQSAHNILIGTDAGRNMLGSDKFLNNIGIGENALSKNFDQGNKSYIANNNFEVAVDSNNILGFPDALSIGNIVIGGNNEVYDAYNLMLGYQSSGTVDINTIGNNSGVNNNSQCVVLGSSQTTINGRTLGANRNTLINARGVTIESTSGEGGRSADNNIVLNAESTSIQDAQANIIGGTSHVLTGGSFNTVLGSGHVLAGTHEANRRSLVVGTDHVKNDAANVFMTGVGHVIQPNEPNQHDNVSLLGNDLRVEAPNGTVVGVLNDPSPTGHGNSLFMVGNGTAKGRTTAFNVNTQGNIMMEFVRQANFADDTAAANGGIPISGLYHTNGTLKIRVS